MNRNIVDLVDKGKLTLTPLQMGALRSSVALMQASKDANEAQSPLGHQKPINSVSQAIILNDGTKGNQLSAAKFTNNIYDAMKSGDKEKADDTLNTFGQFAQHMQNKLIAINAHYAKGGGEKVANTARNAETGVWYQTKGEARQSVIPTNSNSVEYAQKVAIEAEVLSDVYNGLSKAWPTLKGGQHVSETLPKGLQGPVKDVVKAHAKGATLANRSPFSLVQTLAKPGQSDKLTTTRTIKTAKAGAETKPEPAEPGTNGELDRPEATPGAKSPPAISDKGAKAKATYVRALVNILKGSANNSRADLNKLNGHLDGLPEEDVQRVVEETNGHSIAFSNPTGEAKSAITSVVSDLAKRMGVDSLTKLARMIVAITYANGKANAGTYYRTGSFIGISQRFLDAFNAVTRTMDQLKLFLSHELSHAIDFHAATTGREISEDSKFDEIGSLWREFLELKHTDLPEGVAAPAFDYIEGHAARGDVQSFRSEFFAELGSFVLLNPALAKELIPNGTAAFEDAFRLAANHVGWTEAQLVDERSDGNLREQGEGERSESGQAEAEQSPTAEPATKPTTATATSSEPKSRISPEQLARLDDDGLTRRIEANQEKVENDQASPGDEATLKALLGEADRRANENKVEAPKTLQEANPDLIGSKEGEKVTNWFLKAFRLAKTIQGRLVGLASPTQTIRKALSSQANYEKFVGDTFGLTVPKEVFADYRRLLDVIEPLKAELNSKLAMKLVEKDKSGIPLEERLLKGKNFNSSGFGRVFNLLEQQKDGTYRRAPSRQGGTSRMSQATDQLEREWAEEPAVDLLRVLFDYNCKALSSEDVRRLREGLSTEPVLTLRLAECLSRLNPWLGEDGVRRAIAAVTRVAAVV